MLDIIKYLFFTKILFSMQAEKNKLKLVKYNKSLQEIMDISLINYKIYSGRFIEYETKNKGEEYDAYTNKLIFSGHYLNGERNGNGKEYYKDGKIKFEGEFSNGKRHGKGKEYYGYGQLKFEG